jgi:2-polyprenyl-3-methyl-5-hydroxy-6-metoxy-1,4-benzoquinol methylase
LGRVVILEKRDKLDAVKTREPQYQRDLEIVKSQGLTTLGLMTNQAWHDDPKHLLFTLSRYKFVAKMLAGRRRVLEVGCADAWATRIVVQAVNNLTATDFDPLFIQDVKRRMNAKWKFSAQQHDMLKGPFPGKFDGIYALDVIEHISPKQESRFVKNMVGSLSPGGVMILGTPSLESQRYASPPSKAGHVNCKTGKSLVDLMGKLFHNVFLFSMNDEVVHTGFSPMAHYLFVLGCEKKAA